MPTLAIRRAFTERLGSELAIPARPLVKVRDQKRVGKFEPGSEGRRVRDYGNRISLIRKCIDPDF